MIKKLSKIKMKNAPIRCTSIGIMGLSKGVGATHISLIIAGYLHAYYGRRTLYAEACGQRGLNHWLNADVGRQDILKHGIMHMLGISREELMHIKNMGYTYCVLDLGGSYHTAAEELMRCDIKVIIGTAAVWQKDMWRQAEDILKEVKDRSTFCFLVNFGDISDDVKKMLQPAAVYSMPYEPDLSRISNESVHLLRQIFNDYS